MAILKRGEEIFSINNENVISAFLNNGFEVVENIPQPQPVKKAEQPEKKATTKKTTTKK